MNYIKDVLKVLGLEIGEVFHVITKTSDYHFFINERGAVFMKKGAENLSVPSDWLRKIIAGECTIQKELWRPGQYGIYWFYSPIERKVLSMLYSDYSIIGYVMLKIGNCYRTKEGAEKDASKWKEFFDSDELDKLKRKMGNKLKYRKPPEMPYWYWLDTDNCWRCKNRNGCSNCGTVKRYRKKFFKKKAKGISQRKIR